MYHLIIVFRCIIQCPAILFHGQRQIVLHMCHDTDHIIGPGYVNLLIRSQQASHAFVQIPVSYTHLQLTVIPFAILVIGHISVIRRDITETDITPVNVLLFHFVFLLSSVYHSAC